MNLKSIYESIFDKFYDSKIYNYYMYSWLYKIRWKITHWYKKDNWIKTNLPYNYYDKDKLIDEGLFQLIDNFISKDGEDAFSVIYWESHEDQIEAYNKIIDILHFYHVERPKLEKEYDALLDDLYGERFGKRLILNQETKKVNFSNHRIYNDETFEELRKKLQEIEEFIISETQRYLYMIIDIRLHLWT